MKNLVIIYFELSIVFEEQYENFGTSRHHISPYELIHFYKKHFMLSYTFLHLYLF